MNWIGRFENKHPAEVVCPGFYRLRYLAACPYGCPYCFLQSNRFGWPKDITEADLPKMERAVARWLGWQQNVVLQPRLLNAGELSDSFVPEICAQASLRLIELFRRQKRHTLLLLTKARPAALFEIQATPQVIVSFSLGQQVFQRRRIARTVPEGVALIEAAMRLLLVGWRIRLRLDPMHTDARDLMTDFQYLSYAGRIERVTLGSLRATPGLYRLLKNGSETQRALAALLTKQPNSGSHPYRLPLQQRVDLYGKAMEQLKGLATEIGLCKETPKVLAALGLEPESNCCNCIL